MPSRRRAPSSDDMGHYDHDSELPSEMVPDEEEPAEEMLDDGLVDEEDEDGIEIDPNQPEPRPTAFPPAPPGLKEISSLASWTVSTSKPGCGVAALRAPTTTTFWQSDGPQPHHLNIHFFKLVSILAIRIYLDFDLDESYTPTLIRFAAGTSYMDLQPFSEVKVEGPGGWIDVDFSDVGSEGESDDNEDEEMTGMPEEEKENWKRVGKMPVLRAMLVQVKICENHQNGKDTHLRGLQIFAKDTAVRRGALEEEKVVMVPEVANVGTEKGRKKAARRKMEEKTWEIPDFARVGDIR